MKFFECKWQNFISVKIGEDKVYNSIDRLVHNRNQLYFRRKVLFKYLVGSQNFTQGHPRKHVLTYLAVRPVINFIIPREKGIKGTAKIRIN